MSTNQMTAETSTDIDAPVDVVWNAVTTDDGLAAWMGDGATIDPQPDGKISVPDVATGRPREGRVTNIDDGRSLGFTWWPEDDPSDWSVVSVDLVEHDGMTTVTVTETAPRLRIVGAVNAAWAWRGAMMSVSCSTVRA